MAQMNEDPVAFWSDDVGKRWVEAQPHIDRMLVPITARLLDVAAVSPGERILDVGCGCGTTTLRFAEMAGPEGHVVGVDLSPAMIDAATKRAVDATSGRRANFLVADATLYEPDAAVDLVTSRFGVMFFADPPAAFAHLRACTQQGGRLAFVCWRTPEQNPWMRWIFGAFPEADPPMPPLEGPGPYSLADPDHTRELLQGAGWRDVDVDAHTSTISLGEDPAQVLESQMNVGPFSGMLDRAPAQQRPELVARARAFVEAAFERGPVTMPASTWMVTARR